MFLLLLTMAGSQADETDWENKTNKELHDKFQQIMSGQVQDVLNRFEEAMQKIDGMEKTFETKLDNKFNELLTHLPPPPPAALTHLNNNNVAFQIKWDEHNAFPLTLGKLLVPLLMLLPLLLLLQRWRTITRMRLTKIRLHATTRTTSTRSSSCISSQR